MNRILKYLSFTALLLPAFACTEENPEELDSAKVLESVSIVLDDRTEAKLFTDDGEGGTGVELLPMVVGGETVTLGYTTVPADLSEVTFPEMVWSSSNEDVVTVDENGILTAVGPGTAVVTITSAAINTVATASITIRVSETAVPVTSIAVSGAFDADINADREDNDPYLCYVGDEIEFSAVVIPANATFQGVTWSVAPAETDGRKASIDAATGIMTAEATGFVTVTATALDYVPDGEPASADIEVQIITPVDPDGIKFLNAPSESDIFSVTEGSVTVDFDVCPELSTKSRIEWTSSDEDIATVDDGVVTIKTFGSVEITATCPGTGTPETGYTKTATFTVNIPGGYYDEVITDEANVNWAVNPDNISAGAESEFVEGEHGNYILVTPYLDGTSGRADIQRQGTTYLSQDFPVLCFRIDDVQDKTDATYSANINLDTSGYSEDGTRYYGNFGGNNDRWAHKYTCTDGSAFLIYDLASQNFNNSLKLPENEVIPFGTFQFKYAGITPATDLSAIAYRFFWFKTFRSYEECQTYLTDWASDAGLTITNVK